MFPTNVANEFQCPTSEELRAILIGGDPDQAVEDFVAHLTTCPDCQMEVEHVEVNTAVVQALRRPAMVAVPPQQLDKLAEKLRQSGSSLSSHASVHTGGLSADKLRSTAGLAARVPDRLGPYQLQDILGVGGMGMVYRAKDTVLQRTVALKILRFDREQNSRTRERFLREARAIAALQSDHIVTIFQVGELERQGHEPISFLAMELLQGESLFDWMKHTPHPTIAGVVRIGRQAAAGLAAAHAQGLIHRDMKPANLFLEIPASWRSHPENQRPPLAEIARVKLLDFGLAQPLDGEGIRAEESLFGTPGYMAPEHSRGEVIDGRSDLFGLGCVLYELYTHTHPFPERARRKRSEPISGPLIPVRDRNPDVPPALATLIERMLAEDPADRPESAAWVERELALLEADFLQTDTKTTRAAATLELPAPVPITNPRKPRRITALLATVIAASIGIAIYLGVHFFNQPERRVVTETLEDKTSPLDASSAPFSNQTGAVAGDIASFPAWFSEPPDSTWCANVRKLPPFDQISYVLAKLKQLNAGFDGKANRFGIRGDTVAEFSIVSDYVSDIRPVAGFKGLKIFFAVGSKQIGTGKLTDLSPLAGHDLNVLFLHGNPELSDFSVVKGMKGLFQLEVGETKIASLEGLPAGLKILVVSRSQVRDLSPLRTLTKLNNFNCLGCSVDSLEPLAKLPIETLYCDYKASRDEPVIRRMTRLTYVNHEPLQTFLRKSKP